MSEKRELVQSLVRGVRQDIEGYKQLKSLLRRQRQLMQQRNNDALKLHNEHQSALCESLKQSADHRSAALQRLGLVGNSAGMEQLIAKLPPQSSQQVNVIWQQLLTLATESQHANDVNGKLLVDQQFIINNLLRRNVEQTLDYGSQSQSL
ncbi:flagellar export chaperone FlgN [Shewanella surugensis]|uniref:Flagellar protein FlgN n=1 Tax=Shewanella surugensis TaxID=212020 RepID=A0ABT0LAU1_9GAMM|nr:flagellar export chaperone FlgN [Shewanella surugensis]MCL1124792.1 flagellar protein FlgN [Shewanella surugensis]